MFSFILYDLVGGDDEIQKGQLETLFRFKQQRHPASAGFGKLQRGMLNHSLSNLNFYILFLDISLAPT